MLKIGGIYREKNNFDQIQWYFIILNKNSKCYYGYDINFPKYKNSISQKEIILELKKTRKFFYWFLFLASKNWNNWRNCRWISWLY